MKATLQLLLLGIVICISTVLGQEKKDENIQIFVNPNYERSTVNNFFDAQPIYNSDWEWLHPAPQGNALRWVKAWDANNWYALGYSGTFLKTSDAGNTWFMNKNIGGLSSSGFGENLFGGYFIDMNTGLACGEGGTLVRTTDAGLTWNDVISGPTSFLYDVFFLNQTVGFACGLTAVGLWKSTDAGATWTQVPGTLPGNAYSIYAFDENSIILGSANGNVLRTTDGGANWATIFAAGSSLIWDIEFMNSDTGMAVGIDAAIAYTTDGGASWTAANTGIPPTSDFLDVDFRQNTFYITGDPYMIYSTTDLGTTWIGTNYLDPNQAWTTGFYKSDFISDNHFISTGGNGMFNETNTSTSTTTAHTNWIKAGTLYDIWAENSTGRVIAAGAPGISAVTYDHAVYSTDGGDTWAVAVLIDSTEHDFNSLSMVNNMAGYAACEDHFVYKTTDGGESWFQVTQPNISSSDLETIFFTDINTGYTFGANGLGFKTTDGGTSWSPLSTGVTTTLWGSYFLNSNTGFVCGSSGTLLKTTDGGSTFTPLNPNNTSTLYSIYMVDDNVGYVSGSSGRVRVTTDGGLNWGTVDVGNTLVTLYDIQFRDENNGITVGSSGRTFITTDGGATWSFENTGASTIYGVAIEQNFQGIATAFTCGSLGYIQKNTNAIVPVELSAFTASVNGNNVNISWQTSSEQNNLGFGIERKSVNENWNEIGFVEGSGTTIEIKNYSFVDKDLSAGIYFYRIKQTDFDGSYKYYNLDKSVEVGAPEDYSLKQNYPNPFNPTTKIKYNIPSDGFVSLAIYNLIGEKITDVVNEFQKAGTYEVTVNGENLTSGVYLYQLKAGDFLSTRKMMILK